MLAARHLYVRVGTQTLLDDISLSIRLGQVTAVVEPNGAGKSTMVRVLGGEWAPSQGEVVLEDRSLYRWPRRERARRLAVLPQQSTLSFPFTVLDVVLMGRTPHMRGTESANDIAIAQAALAEVELSGFVDRLYPSLSGGERQRVPYARILAQLWEAPLSGSRYLLLDEPTASLDLAYQHQVLTHRPRLGPRTGWGHGRVARSQLGGAICRSHGDAQSGSGGGLRACFGGAHAGSDSDGLCGISRGDATSVFIVSAGAPHTSF